MALVPKGNGSGFWLSVTLVDNGDDKAIKDYELTSADYATALTDTAAVLAAIALTSGSTISGYNLSLRMTEDSFVYPVSGIENQNKARVVVQLTTGTEKATIDIPAALPSLFQAVAGSDANLVDLSSAGWLAYSALFSTGNECFISDGEILNFSVRGRRVSSRKGFRG